MHEEPFEYSALAGRFGTPAAGVVLLTGLLLAAAVGGRGAPGAAIGVLVTVALVLAAGGAWITEHGTTTLPWGRRRSVNLVAVRGKPSVWLVAHLDSKSQPVPMLARIAGIVGGGVAWATLLVVALLAPGISPAAWTMLGLAGALLTLPVVLSTVGQASFGALDNASGVATVLASVANMSQTRQLGVLITSAEELGLAGARAWANVHRDLGIVLNVDGVDDTGTVIAMYAGARPAALVAAIDRAGKRAGVAVRARRLLPGVLVDAVAMRKSCSAAITFSRGTMSTLARIHTRRDSLDTMTGSGVDDVARLLTHLVETLD